MVEATNTRVLTNGRGGFVSTPDNGVETDPSSRPFMAILDPLRAVQAQIRAIALAEDPTNTNPRVPMTINDYVDTAFLVNEQVEISYIWNNVYGNEISPDSSITCPSTVTKSIQVNRLPVVEFSATVGEEIFTSGTASSAEICVETDAFSIVRNAANGNVDPNFYIDTDERSVLRGAIQFDPDAVRSRVVSIPDPGHRYTRATNHTVTYLASNANECFGFVSDTITIHSIPDLNFSPNEGCRAENVMFRVTVGNLDNLRADMNELDEFVWDFGFEGEEPDTLMGSEFTITRSFDEGRNYDILLTSTTEKGCKATRVKDLDIGVIPIPELAWEGGTASRPIDFKFYESALTLSRTEAISLHVEQDGMQIGRAIMSRSTDDAGTEAADLFTSLKFDPVSDGDGSGALVNPGVYDLVLSVTSTVNCTESRRRSIRIVPNVSVGESGYRIDFENEPEHWYADTLLVITRRVNDNLPSERGKPEVIIVNKDEDGNDRPRDE